jgi:hypothetical protein
MAIRKMIMICTFSIIFLNALLCFQFPQIETIGLFHHLQVKVLVVLVGAFYDVRVGPLDQRIPNLIFDVLKYSICLFFRLVSQSKFNCHFLTTKVKLVDDGQILRVPVLATRVQHELVRADPSFVFEQDSQVTVEVLVE